MKPRYVVKETFQYKDNPVQIAYWQGTKHWGEITWARTWASAQAAENAYFRRFGRSTSASSVKGRRFEIIPIEMLEQ